MLELREVLLLEELRLVDVLALLRLEVFDDVLALRPEVLVEVLALLRLELLVEELRDVLALPEPLRLDVALLVDVPLVRLLVLVVALLARVSLPVEEVPRLLPDTLEPRLLPLLLLPELRLPDTLELRLSPLLLLPELRLPDTLELLLPVLLLLACVLLLRLAPPLSLTLLLRLLLAELTRELLLDPWVRT